MSKAVVFVQDARSDHSDRIPSEEDFNRWVSLPLKEITQSHELTIRIVDDTEIRQLNRGFRGRDKPTNVLSFSYDDHPQGYLGDVVICAPVVVLEAEEYGIAAEHHWAHLVIHGVLHLLGYDHEIQKQADKMESREIALLAELNIANPYATAISP